MINALKPCFSVYCVRKDLFVSVLAAKPCCLIFKQSFSVTCLTLFPLVVYVLLLAQLSKWILLFLSLSDLLCRYTHLYFFLLLSVLFLTNLSFTHAHTLDHPWFFLSFFASYTPKRLIVLDSLLDSFSNTDTICLGHSNPCTVHHFPLRRRGVTATWRVD